MSDEKSQSNEPEAPASPGHDTDPKAGAGAKPEADAKPDVDAKADVPRREWKPTPKFDYAQVEPKAPKAAPAPPAPDLIVLTSHDEPTEFPYGLAAVFAVLLLMGVYAGTAWGDPHAHHDAHGGHGGHGAAGDHGPAGHHDAPAHGAVQGTAQDAKAHGDPAPAARKPQPRNDVHTRAKVDAPAAAGEVAAAPAGAPPEAGRAGSDAAAEPNAEPAPEPKAEPEPAPAPAAKAAPAGAGGALAEAQAELDARKWFGAYRSAKAIYDEDKSDAALEIMATAACRTKKADKIKFVSKRLSGDALTEMRKTCESVGAPLP